MNEPIISNWNISNDDILWLHRYLQGKGVITEHYMEFRSPTEIDQILNNLGNTKEAERFIRRLRNALTQHRRRAKNRKEERRFPFTFELSIDSKDQLKELTSWNNQSQSNLLENLINKEYVKQTKKKGMASPPMASIKKIAEESRRYLEVRRNEEEPPS